MKNFPTLKLEATRDGAANAFAHEEVPAGDEALPLSEDESVAEEVTSPHAGDHKRYEDHKEDQGDRGVEDHVEDEDGANAEEGGAEDQGTATKVRRGGGHGERLKRENRDKSQTLLSEIEKLSTDIMTESNQNVQKYEEILQKLIKLIGSKNVSFKHMDEKEKREFLRLIERFSLTNLANLAPNVCNDDRIHDLVDVVDVMSFQKPQITTTKPGTAVQSLNLTKNEFKIRNDKAIKKQNEREATARERIQRALTATASLKEGSTSEVYIQTLLTLASVLQELANEKTPESNDLKLVRLKPFTTLIENLPQLKHDPFNLNYSILQLKEEFGEQLTFDPELVERLRELLVKVENQKAQELKKKEVESKEKRSKESMEAWDLFYKNSGLAGFLMENQENAHVQDLKTSLATIKQDFLTEPDSNLRHELAQVRVNKVVHKWKLQIEKEIQEKLKALDQSLTKSKSRALTQEEKKSFSFNFEKEPLQQILDRLEVFGKKGFQEEVERRAKNPSPVWQIPDGDSKEDHIKSFNLLLTDEQKEQFWRPLQYPWYG